MAYEFYVTVNGTKQGKFKGETIRAKHKGKITGLRFYYEVKSPRDSASGQATGKRTHQPVTFVKQWGPASPQFFQALTTNEILKSVLFEFMHSDGNGAEQIFHSILLTNASVCNYKAYLEIPTDSASLNVPELEEISLTFQRIEIESKTGKTMAVDDWSQRS